MLSILGISNGLSSSIILFFGIAFGFYLLIEGRKAKSKNLFYLGIFIMFSGLSFLGTFIDFVHILFFGHNFTYNLLLFRIISNIWIAPLVTSAVAFGTRLVIPKYSKLIGGIICGISLFYLILLIIDPFNSITYLIPETPGEDLLKVHVREGSLLYILTMGLILTEFILFGIGFFYKSIRTKGLIRRKYIYLSGGFLVISIAGLIDPSISQGFLLIILRFIFLSGFLLWYIALRTEKIDSSKRMVKIEENLFRLSLPKEIEKELSNIRRLKSDLLNRASHELKTPLISIKGYSDMILNFYRDKLDPSLISIVDQIQKGCHRLENRINEFLRASQLSADKIKIQKKYYDLKDVVDKILTELVGAIKVRNHNIIIKMDKPYYTLFDKEHIKEVISNLIINAIKYTPSGGIIEISLFKEGKEIVFSVKDTGIGITNKEMKVLFQKFGKIERYGQGWDIKSDGTGLGLYYSKEIMKLHGGRIWVDSGGRNKGSKFCISLPIKPPKEKKK